MKRGEVWTAAAGGYAGKPRPVVIIQDDLYRFLDSITFCPLTTEDLNAPLVRPRIEPGPDTGLRAPSQVMVDKITTAPKDRLGNRIGELSDEDMLHISRALVLFLGIGP